LDELVRRLVFQSTVPQAIVLEVKSPFSELDYTLQANGIKGIQYVECPAS
jgi:hypothetical protein